MYPRKAPKVDLVSVQEVRVGPEACRRRRARGRSRFSLEHARACATNPAAPTLGRGNAVVTQLTGRQRKRADGRRSLNLPSLQRNRARPEGIEPPTFGFEVGIRI